MGELRYQTIHEDLIAALPQLAVPYGRLFADWGNFEGLPPGQYLVFADTLATQIKIALELPEGTPGRDRLLGEALDFGEAMLAAEDRSVHDLAIDAVAEWLDAHPAGREVAARLGGPLLNAWFDRYGRPEPVAPSDRDIIDLYGVRAELAGLLPETPPAEIPGISHPAGYLVLESVRAAREVDDGAVILTVGTHYAVLRAADVALGDAELDRLAKALARYRGGEDPLLHPRVEYYRIPMNERVHGLDVGTRQATRLGSEPWVADALSAVRAPLLAYLRGEAGPPRLEPSARARLTARLWRATQ